MIKDTPEFLSGSQQGINQVCVLKVGLQLYFISKEQVKIEFTEHIFQFVLVAHKQLVNSMLQSYILLFQWEKMSSQKMTTHLHAIYTLHFCRNTFDFFCTFFFFFLVVAFHFLSAAQKFQVQTLKGRSYILCRCRLKSDICKNNRMALFLALSWAICEIYFYLFIYSFIYFLLSNHVFVSLSFIPR